MVDQLAVQIIMVEPGDMMALGSILQQVESLEKRASESGLRQIGEIGGALAKLVQKIILDEIPNPREGLDLLNFGVKVLQEKISQPSSSSVSSEESSFWEKMSALTGEKNPAVAVSEQGSSHSASTRDSSSPGQSMEIYQDFISEAMEHLESVELNLLRLEQCPGDKECVNSIFRPFHTIKGVSGFLNLQTIHRFSHAVESLLDAVRNDRISIRQPIVDLVLDAVDLLKSMILDLKGNLEKGRIEVSAFDIEPYLERIASLARGDHDEEAAGFPLAGKQEAEPSRLPIGAILSARGVVSDEEVQEALRKQKEEKTDLKLGEILIKDNKVKAKEVAEALREQKRPMAHLGDTAVKVDTTKLDNLVDLVGELVIAQSQVQQNPVFASLSDPKLFRDLSQLNRITADLQKIAMALRMVPIRQTFQKMIRLVRDLAKKSGKQVELVMSGEETEIDRNMVDALYEPLVHMIRNAVDHGIEVPERRKQFGKPDTGLISLRAYQKGGNVVIEIEDDGQGLNCSKILRKAIERGLVQEGQQLTEHQIENLIFKPGFSTADQVTDVSGRGVGMDVVKKAIEQLKGKVEIFSQEGKGCRFVIRIPLTLAIMDGITVRVGQERYIIPTVFIRETLRPGRKDIVSVQNKGEMIKVRNTLVPLIRLYSLLGVAPEQREPWQALVVIVENEGCQNGLMVDELVGKQEVVIKNLGRTFKTVNGLAGATIMGDGRVGLILDIHGIFEVYRAA